MRPRTVLAVLVGVLLVAALAVWAVFQDETDAPRETETPAATPADATKPADAAHAEARKRARAGPSWVELGVGEVAGVVMEYGTERPLADLDVTLEAPSPGPDRTLKARTAADGSFLLSGVPNFDDWTLRVAAPAPLASVEQGGVTVVEDKRTDLGVLYVTPAFAVPGIVVDDHGEPVEGAEVRALRAKGGASQMDILRLIREFPVESPAVDKATTGKDGRFRLTKTSPGSYDFKVLGAGRQVLVERGVVVTPDAERRELRFVLAKGNTLEGRVVRKGPGTVVGLTVVAMLQPRGETDLLGLDRTFAKTDENGRFRIDGLGAGRYVVGAAPPEEPFALNLDVGIPDTTFLELTIEGDAWIEGRVTGKAAAPLPGASVYVVHLSDRPVIASTRTGPDGRYALRGLRAGPIGLLLVQAEGYATWPADVASAFQGGGEGSLVLQTGRNEKDISLEPGGTVKGVVLSKDDDRPLDGVRVELGTPLALFGGSRGTTTDAQGRFEITSAPLGSSVLLASKDGWSQPGLNPMTIGMVFQNSAKRKQDSGTGFVVSIAEPGQVVERTIKLTRGTVLAGQVLAPDGTPVAGARVELEIESEGGMLGGIRALFGATDPRMSDAEGRFELPGPQPGSKGRVLAKSPGFLDGRSDLLVPKAVGERTEGIVVTLRQGAVLEGRVTSARDGTAIENASVRWAVTSAKNQWRARAELESSKPTTTDADGRFRIEHVETGTVTVQVSHPRHLAQTFQGVAVAEGKPSVVEARLQPGGILEGTVIGPDAKPCSAALVFLEYQRTRGESDDDPYTNESRRVTSDSAGKFRVENLAAGRFEIRAEAQGAAPSERVIAATGGAPVTLRLQPALRIAGVVRSQGGPVAGVEVEVRKAARVDGDGNRIGGGEHVGTYETDRTGRFVVDDIPAGVYEIEFSPRSWGAGVRANIVPKTVSDVAAGNEALAIDLEPGLSISGSVSLAEGELVEGCGVWVQQLDAEGREMRDGVRGWYGFESGDFDVVGLVPGTYSLSVNVDGHGRRTVKAEAGARDVRVVLGGGGRITGRILEDGKPVGGVWVWCNRTDGGGGDGAQSDTDGVYTVKGLEPGVYTVNANWNRGGAQKSGAVEGVEVRTGITSTVDVTIKAAE